MNGCEYSMKIIKISIRARITGLTFLGNKHTATERITQTTDDYKISRKNNYSILRRMDDYYSDKNGYPTSKEAFL